jgi:plastocyanin
MWKRLTGKTTMRTLLAAGVISLACVLQAVLGMTVLAAPTTHTVVIAGMKFAPESLTVREGDTIVWVNEDFFPHTATAQDGSFDSQDIAVSQSWKYVATKNGTFTYICTLHPTMKGTLVVKRIRPRAQRCALWKAYRGG